jgi:hypothetical protein
MALIPRLYNPNTVILTANDIDWLAGTWFARTITANATITMSNTDNVDSTITLALTNSTAGSLTLTWPGSIKWSGGAAIVTIAATKTTIFTFIKINGLIYATGIENYV